MDKAQEPSSASKEELVVNKLELWGTLVKALIWPVIFLLFFLFNCKALKSIVDEIPSKLRESDKVTVGSLSFEISKKATQQGNPELGVLTKGLSAKAIEELLLTGSITMAYAGSLDEQNAITFPGGKKLEAIMELYNKKLLEFRIPLDEYNNTLEKMKLEKLQGESFDKERITVKLPNKPEDVKYLKSQNYNLSDLGRKAFELVIEAVKSNVQSAQNDKDALTEGK